MDEMLILKQNILGGMNEYIIELGDEEVWEWWITVFPDEVTEDDLIFIAEDELLWVEVCTLFGKIVAEYGV